MNTCDICGDRNTSPLFTTPVVTNKQKEKYIKVCQECIERLCDAGIGKWFSTRQDEAIRLPDRTFMHL